MVTSYLLASTIVTALVGRLGDLFGRKLVFQAAVTFFVVGSVLCGLSQSMVMLVGARALQGIGGGAITVTATALIGEVIPLRDRGRYQGALGAVFGVTTVIGPLLGGYFTDHLTWRWAFWVNVPVSIVVFFVAAAAIPTLAARGRPVIDYAGIVFVGLGATGLTLATSWGGTTYPWGSPTIIGLFVGSAAALGIFVWVESRRRGADPADPAVRQSGLHGVLCAVVRGRVRDAGRADLPADLHAIRRRRLGDHVGTAHAADGGGDALDVDRQRRPGRPDRPIQDLPGRRNGGDGARLSADVPDGPVDVGTAAIAVPVHPRRRYRLVHAGAGPDRAEHVEVRRPRCRHLGRDVLPHDRQFVRCSDFRLAVHQLPAMARIGPALAASGASPAAANSPEALHRLPRAMAAPIVDAYAASLTQVFLWAVPVALVGFALSLFLREVPLRDIGNNAADLGDGFAMPTTQTPEEMLETAIGRLLRGEPGMRLRSIAMRPDCRLDVAELWALLRINRYQRAFGIARITDIGDQLGIPYEVLEPTFDRLVRRGYAQRDVDRLWLTPPGAASGRLRLVAAPGAGSSTSSPGRPTSRADPTAVRSRPRSTGSLTGSSLNRTGGEATPTDSQVNSERIRAYRFAVRRVAKRMDALGFYCQWPSGWRDRSALASQSGRDQKSVPEPTKPSTTVSNALNALGSNAPTKSLTGSTPTVAALAALAGNELTNSSTDGSRRASTLGKMPLGPNRYVSR